MFSYVGELLSTVTGMVNFSQSSESTPTTIMDAAHSLVRDPFDDEQIELERKGRRLQEWNCLHLCNFLYRSEDGDELLPVIRNMIRADIQVKQIYDAFYDEEQKAELTDLLNANRTDMELILKLVGKEIDRINELLL